jgi:hypothetical protein
MGAVILMVLVGLVVVMVVANIALRNWVSRQAGTEARLLSPETHTVGYVVPDGQDPAVLMAAVTRAGFEAIVDTSGRAERVLVACADSDRNRVRAVLEDVHRTGFDGAAMRVEHVVFDDE